MNAALACAVFFVVGFFVWQVLLDPRVGVPAVFLMRLMETLALLSAMSVTWPTAVREFLTVITVVNFNTEIFRSECTLGAPAGPVKKGIGIAFLPAITFAAGVMLFPVLKLVSKFASKLPDENQSFNDLAKPFHPVRARPLACFLLTHRFRTPSPGTKLLLHAARCSG
jgi:hypothetical protein